MTDKACATCAKRHPAAHGELECRARPPRQDVAKFARFPVVRPDDYCWEYDLELVAVARPTPAIAEAPLLEQLDAAPPAAAPKSTKRTKAAPADGGAS